MITIIIASVLGLIILFGIIYYAVHLCTNQIRKESEKQTKILIEIAKSQGVHPGTIAEICSV